MNQGVRVPVESAEAEKQSLQRAGELKDGLRPLHEQDYVVFPVTSSYDGSTVERDFPSYDTTPSFREKARELLSGEEMKSLISSYDIIGRIALIQIRTELEHKEVELAKALLDANPQVDTVRKRSEARTGKYRLRSTTYLAGEETSMTTHTEHGVTLQVDVDTVYFSPRLSRERARIATLVEPEESVLVMFSGCAPYPCVIAQEAAPERVTGVEWNEAGHRLGLRNVEENGFGDIITLCNGDVRRVVPDLGVFDRVIMPAPHSADGYLDLLGEVLRREGSAHVYRFEESPSEDWIDVEDREVTVHNIEHCGDRSPSEARVCYDIVMD